MAPGQWTHQLNSPERGEGRWSQNYARLLALEGHQVFAASMGRPEPRISEGVNLIHETEVAKYGPYDMYIDSAWWKEKEPKGKAKKYIIFKWSLEEYTRKEKLPDNFFLGHPYPSHQFEFTKGVNADKTFAMPTMFGIDFEKSKWGNNKIFLPGKIDTGRDYKKYIPIISDYLRRYPVEGSSRDFFEKELMNVDFKNPESTWYEKRPYNEVLDSMRRSKISLPILNPGAIIEATFQGIPSIFWEQGGFYNPLAESLDILIKNNAEPERFIEVMEQMLNNKKKYHEVLYASQDYFSCHTYKSAIKYFNLMVESVF
jgi:hypothetical protein